MLSRSSRKHGLFLLTSAASAAASCSTVAATSLSPSLSLLLGTGQPKEIWWAGLRALNRYLSAADAAAVI